MGFDVSRLRRGEWLAGGGALVLLLSLFVLPWYGVKSPFASTASQLPGAATSWNGWQGLEHLRWLVLLTALVTLALVWFQASLRSPAIPVSLSVIVTVLGLLNALALIYRVLINQPGTDDLVSLKAGAYIGVVASLALFYGGYLSTRDEGLSDRDARTEIETVSLGPPAPGTPS